MTWHAKRFYVRAAVVPARTGSFSPWHTHPHPQAQQASTARGLALQEEVKKVGNQNQRGVTRLEKKGASAPPRTSAVHRRNPTPFRVDARPVWHGIGSEGRGGRRGAIIRRADFRPHTPFTQAEAVGWGQGGRRGVSRAPVGGWCGCVVG